MTNATSLSSTNNALDVMALGASPAVSQSKNEGRSGGAGGSSGGGSSWFQALATAWGQSLDSEASKLESMSDNIGQGGNEDPSEIAQLSAESLRMSFLSQSEESSITAAGQSLQTMARKD